MKRAIIISIVLFAVVNTFSQNKENETKKSANHAIPQTNIKVNKEYDKNGNIIKYDSTYTSYYSNIESDSIMNDSIFNDFKKNFNDKYFFSNEPFFNNYFFRDSIMRNDFNDKDFFYKEFRSNMEQMDKLFWDMDSVKNEFFDRQYKSTVPKKPDASKLSL
jgi:hypothetical protein